MNTLKTTSFYTFVSVAFVICLFGISSCSQVKNLAQEVDEAADQVLDSGSSSEDEATQGTAASEVPEITQAASFTPGDSLLFKSHFDAAGGEGFLNYWKTNGAGQIVTVEGQPGKWLALQEGSTYQLQEQIFYPEHFTIEFDLLAVAGVAGDINSVYFGFAPNNSARKHITSGQEVLYIDLLYMNENEIHVSGANEKYSFLNFNLVNTLNRPMHVAISVDGQQASVYLNGHKIVGAVLFDEGDARNFFISGPNSYDNGARVLISNVRIATFENK